MILCTNVLVAIDFSPAADKALRYGRELSRLFGAKLHALHVVSDLGGVGILPPAYMSEMGQAQQERLDSARARLQTLAEDDADPVTTLAAIRVSSSPAAEILDYVTDQHIDLVVVGSHGHGPVAGLLLGSVADKVVRNAPCPVLTVREDERDFVRPIEPPRAVQATPVYPG